MFDHEIGNRPAKEVRQRQRKCIIALRNCIEVSPNILCIRFRNNQSTKGDVSFAIKIYCCRPRV